MKQSWKIKSLGDVCDELFAGGDVPKNNFSKNKTERFNIPIFSNGMKNKGLYGYTDIKKVTKPSITISARGTIGYSEIRKENFYPVIRLIVLIPKREILSLPFLHYVVSSIDFSNSGTSIPQLTVPMVKKYTIPIPPIPEQKRIVEILDKAFAAIDKAKANAQKNLQNSRELFDSYLNKVFACPGEDWEEKKLGEVCNTLNGGTPKTGVKEYWDGNVKWITPKDMGKLSSKFVDDTPRKITSLGLQKSSAKLLPSNSLILSTRAPIGHLAINTSEMATNQGCRGIIPSSKINIQYLYYFFSNSIDLLNSLGTGATFRELSAKALSSVKIPLPPIHIQDKIIAKFNALSTDTKKLETIYQKKLADLEELKKSILQKAFDGEL
ncbi:restriction endonuclease subunit S [candidate division KSB1 bacterium]|nr:restriction endonuclease subunit S [candidate division KSB1 bacterium]